MSKNQMTQIETTVRRGFPVVVTGRFVEAEPDVGFMTAGFEDLAVCTLKGRSADFLRLTERELDELACELMEVFNRLPSAADVEPDARDFQ